MSKIILGIILSVFLIGCNSSPVIEGTDIQAKAGNIIAKTELALVHGFNLISDQAKAGVLFKEEVAKINKVLVEASQYLDKAHELYDKGLFAESIEQALNSDRILEAVEAEVAKKLKERRAS